MLGEGLAASWLLLAALGCCWAVARAPILEVASVPQPVLWYITTALVQVVEKPFCRLLGPVLRTVLDSQHSSLGTREPIQVPSSTTVLYPTRTVQRYTAANGFLLQGHASAQCHPRGEADAHTQIIHQPVASVLHNHSPK